jgi:DNA mismatch endonuclease, patch repair protein
MSDTRRPFVPTEVGRRLSGRPTTNTRPELLLRQALHRAGLRFRIHVRLAAACNPDLILPRHGLAVWVDGCFWHGHTHVRPVERGPNVDLWQEKFAANKQRDQRAVEMAERLGWVPLRVWECEIHKDLPGVVGRILSASRAPDIQSGPS